jgi:hypothetical protein
LNTEEIKRTAIHEAGHATCIVLCGLPLWRVEILPTGLSNIYYRVVLRSSFQERIAGACLLTRWGRWGWMRLPAYDWRADAHVCCAGYAAEALCCGRVDREAAADDFEHVRHILSKDDRGVSLDTICIETVALLSRHRSAIRAIADELLASKRLTGARVKEIIQEGESR